MLHQREVGLRNEMGQELAQEMARIDREIAELEENLESVTGSKTEVYTRIVGYHRDVSQWNKGKREEYRHRITFNLADSMGASLNQAKLACDLSDSCDSCSDRNNAKQIAYYKLFFSPTCMNCPSVKVFMSGISTETKLEGKFIDVTTPEGLEAAKEYSVMSLPTVILFSEDMQILHICSSVQELKEIFGLETCFQLQAA